MAQNSVPELCIYQQLKKIFDTDDRDLRKLDLLQNAKMPVVANEVIGIGRYRAIDEFVIVLVAQQPETTWGLSAPSEYGFYSNVNPRVPHPRWSQAQERRIGEFGLRDTLMFNGYADDVAHLYANMDLKKYF